MNDGSFGILKALFENSNCVLWYTSGCRADNPHANMIRGFGRSLLWELPDLRIQFLDLEDSDLSDMDATKIAHEALQFCLSIVMQDKGMLKNVLWSIEPEIVRRQNRTLIPRIKPNEQQNKRFNSKRRKISAEIDPRQTCIELCHDAQGFSLNQRHSLNIFDSAKEDLVNVDSSSISALRLNSECSGFLVFGQHLQSEEWVLGFSRTNASKVHIEAGLRTPVRSADVSGTFLSQVTALIVHERILSQARPGSTLLIHGPDRSLARLIEKACEVGHLRCLFTTTDNSKVTGTSWKLLHPFSRSMSLKQFVPLDTSVFVDLSTDHTEKQMGLALRNLLPQGCKKYDSSLFLAESSFALHHQEYQASLKMLLERAIQAVEADKVSRVSTHLFSINEISKIPPQDLPPVAVMTWNTAEEPTCTAIIRPFDSESLFRSDRTYWLIGLTGDLGLSLCKYMHDKGAKNIVLSSRSPNVDARWLAEMRTHGAVVTIVAW
jgi:hybrid polyketide synthase/nonribosomal peptide synthetase ACE1